MRSCSEEATLHENRSSRHVCAPSRGSAGPGLGVLAQKCSRRGNFLARNASETEITSVIGVGTAAITPPCNVTLVSTPTEAILIDVGAGPHYMPGAGKLAENMEAARIDRHSISKVVLTHAHPRSSLLTRWVRMRLRAALWRQWKTPRRRRAELMARGVPERLASNTASCGYGSLARHPNQSSDHRAFKRLLPIARTPTLGRGVMAQPLEPPWYGPVCPVVWEGRSREAPPYPDPWHFLSVGCFENGRTALEADLRACFYQISDRTRARTNERPRRAARCRRSRGRCRGRQNRLGRHRSGRRGWTTRASGGSRRS